MLFNNKAQGTLEYAIIIGVVVAALIAMQAYFKRGLQGKIRQASDEIGEQFSPGKTTGSVTNTSKYITKEVVTLIDGKPTTVSTTTSEKPQKRTVTETVETLDKEKIF